MSYELYTERLTLRPLAENDADAIAEQIGDWDVIRWLSTPPYPYARSEAESFISRAQNPNRRGLVRALDMDGQFIGIVGLGEPNPDWQVPEGALELGYWLGQLYWGHGFASEAAQAMLRHGFETLHLPEIVAGAFLDNASSLSVLHKSGFETVGVMPVFNAPQNKVMNGTRMRLSRSRWHALNIVG